MAFDWTAWSPPANGSPSDTAAWWGTHMASLQNALGASYGGYTGQIASLAGQYSGWTAPQWTGSGAWDQYQSYQGGMSGLLARIGGGYQPSDFTQANADVAQAYGMSPVSWTALQESIPELLNASNTIAKAGNIATDLANSPFGQQQEQAMRVAERQATDAVGKQLEAIFGERGGLAGFQAAYDLTSQLQSNFMQQSSQNNLAMFDRAIQQVNAENGYYKDLIDRGAIQAQDYLKMRWDSLQQGYQDYASAMDQTLKTWQVQEQVSQQEWQAAQDNITNQINAVEHQLATEMGINDQALTAISTAMGDSAKTRGNTPGSSGSFTDFANGAGDTLLAAGGAVALIPGAGIVGVGMMILGGIFKLGAGLVGLFF